VNRGNSEPLTPQRVRSATFSPSRLGRRGVDEAQVNAFCGWVSDELARMLAEKAEMEEEVLRLRERVLEGNGAGVRPEDGHVQAVYVLSKAQETADRYVANAQEYSREIAEDARKRRDEILREAKVRASVIMEEAHASASQAAQRVPPATEPLSAADRRDLEAEIAYLRTFSDVCRTHLRAYLESLTRSVEEWERAEQQGAARAAAQATRGPVQAQAQAQAQAYGSAQGSTPAHGSPVARHGQLLSERERPLPFRIMLFTARRGGPARPLPPRPSAWTAGPGRTARFPPRCGASPRSRTARQAPRTCPG
jgi:cell division septum initiation protein DivIVA